MKKVLAATFVCILLPVLGQALNAPLPPSYDPDPICSEDEAKVAQEVQNVLKEFKIMPEDSTVKQVAKAIKKARQKTMEEIDPAMIYQAEEVLSTLNEQQDPSEPDKLCINNEQMATVIYLLNTPEQ